jgi:hypothetical protein
MSAMLPDLPAVVLTESQVQRVAHGGAVVAGDLDVAYRGAAAPEAAAAVDSRSAGGAAARPVRLLSPSGALLAIATPSGPPGTLHPLVVLM